jgi:hypothetical protein
MIKKPCRIIEVPTKFLKVISPEAPRDADAHDEWLLDEALGESFPASDSIAVSPSHLFRANSPRRSREIGAVSEISKCNIGHGKQLAPNTVKTAIECDFCHTESAATVALSFEGGDYIYHFCGQQCLDGWSKATGAHDK